MSASLGHRIRGNSQLPASERTGKHSAAESSRLGRPFRSPCPADHQHRLAACKALASAVATRCRSGESRHPVRQLPTTGLSPRELLHAIEVEGREVVRLAFRGGDLK
jgi:hypothetical protein